jgi:hypothetical protein
VILFKLQVLLLLGCLFALVYFILKIKAYKLELKYTILWMFVIVLCFFLAAFPSLLNFVSYIIGIETPVNTLFLCALIACFLVMYSLTSTISTLSNKVKQLSQEVGLMKAELELLKKGRRLE